MLYADSCMQVSDQPRLYSFSVKKGTDGFDVLNNAKEFVIHLMPKEFSEEYKEKILKLTKYQDSFKELDISPIESTKIDCPKLPNAVEHMECEKVKEMEMGDSIVVIGRSLFHE